MSVTVLDALTYAGSRESLRAVEDQIRMVEGDLTDEPLVDRLVAESDAVVHFAAETHVDNSLTDPAAFLRSNVIGTYSVLEAVRTGAPASHLHRRGLRRPATQRAGALHRRDAVQPVQPVLGHQGLGRPAGAGMGAVLRRAGDHLELLQQLRPYQHVEKFIPRQITNLLTGRRPKLYGAGANVRDWIHVDDHNSAVWRILDGGTIGRTYLIGADGERDNLSVLRLILQLMGRDPDDFDHVTDRAGRDLRYAIDSERVARRAGLGAEAHRLRRGSRRHHRVVPRQRVVVGAAQGAGRGRLRETWSMTWPFANCPFPDRGITLKPHGDSRGMFFEWFTESGFAEMTGHAFDMRQANCSVSARGVLRACTSRRCRRARPST